MRPSSSASTNPRVLGTYGDDTRGPVLLALGGMHGNEPGGLEAGRRVLKALRRLRVEANGKLVVLSGNRSALALGARYIDIDLNRIWSPEELRGGGERFEDRERDELLVTFDELELRRHSAVHLLDMHSTSGPSSPYAIVEDREESREFAERLGFPVIMGIDQHLSGTLLQHFGAIGYNAVAVEGGQHDAPETVASHELAIWRSLRAAGILAEDHEPATAQFVPEAATGLIIEVWHREVIDESDDFTMVPGYRNLQSVSRGELLAYSGADGTREVRAERDSILLMPRYQAQGTEGFFLGSVASTPSHELG